MSQVDMNSEEEDNDVNEDEEDDDGDDDSEGEGDAEVLSKISGKRKAPPRTQSTAKPPLNDRDRNGRRQPPAKKSRQSEGTFITLLYIF